MKKALGVHLLQTSIPSAHAHFTEGQREAHAQKKGLKSTSLPHVAHVQSLASLAKGCEEIERLESGLVSILCLSTLTNAKTPTGGCGGGLVRVSLGGGRLPEPQTHTIRWPQFKKTQRSLLTTSPPTTIPAHPFLEKVMERGLAGQHQHHLASQQTWMLVRKQLWPRPQAAPQGCALGGKPFSQHSLPEGQWSHLCWLEPL